MYRLLLNVSALKKYYSYAKFIGMSYNITYHTVQQRINCHNPKDICGETSLTV